MKNICAPFVLSILMLALNVTVARAADRVQAGQWEMTIANSRLLRSPTGCTVKDVKVSGNQVTLNTICGGEENMNTTTYHGDWYEQVNSNGMKVSAKRIGACP